MVEATARAAGEYYLLASHRLLTASPDQHPTELMDLQGVRYVVAEETPEARRLSVVRLKQTVGTPQITARRIAKDSVTFDATHSLFVSTNYRPVVEESDHGTWRRLLLVRFPYTFRKPHEPLTGPDDRRGDPGLRQRVKDDPAVSAAVLAWMVEGARRWYEHADRGELPAPPATVLADTRAWRGESDQVLAYITERLRIDATRHVAGIDLLCDINGWLAERGHREWTPRTLSWLFPVPGERSAEVGVHAAVRAALARRIRAR
jgi:putative DNA primase/helicase